jgi:hypothetical protein
MSQVWFITGSSRGIGGAPAAAVLAAVQSAGDVFGRLDVVPFGSADRRGSHRLPTPPRGDVPRRRSDLQRARGRSRQASCGRRVRRHARLALTIFA